MAHTNGFVVWFTGMLGTGKTTLANYVAARLRQVGRSVEILDEEEVSESLFSGLGDSKDERKAIVRRLGYVANLLSRNNVAVLVAASSPYKAGREENRRLLGRYVEVFVDCATETLIQRDSTGQYKKALSGEIPNFIGITEPYEPPGSPEVTVHSESESVDSAGTRIFQALLDLTYVSTDELKVITGTRMKPTPPGKKGGKPAKAKVKAVTSGTRASKVPAKAAKVSKKKKK